MEAVRQRVEAAEARTAGTALQAARAGARVSRASARARLAVVHSSTAALALDIAAVGRHCQSVTRRARAAADRCITAVGATATDTAAATDATTVTDATDATPDAATAAASAALVTANVTAADSGMASDAGLATTPATLAVEKALQEDTRASGVFATALPEKPLAFSDRKLLRIPPFVFADGAIAMALTSLDVSRNQIGPDLPPSIGRLTALTVLNVSRNKLKRLPAELEHLTALVAFDVSSNTLKLGGLALDTLGHLPELRVLDLRYNCKIFDDSHTALLVGHLQPEVEFFITPRVLFEDRDHAADRDAGLIGSQLEPHATGTLRRRLALTFGDTTDPEKVDRDEMISRQYSPLTCCRLFVPLTPRCTTLSTYLHLLVPPHMVLPCCKHSLRPLPSCHLAT